MNIQVFYHSSTGNTAKLAEAIAAAVGAKARQIDDAAALSEPADLLFIGDGVYFGKPNKGTVRFIEGLGPELAKNVAVFATYGGQAKIGADINALLAKQGLHIAAEPFLCKGQSWVLMNRGHPDAADLERAAGYARGVATGIE